MTSYGKTAWWMQRAGASGVMSIEANTEQNSFLSGAYKCVSRLANE
jgi:hypothetical protein